MTETPSGEYSAGEATTPLSESERLCGAFHLIGEGHFTMCSRIMPPVTTLNAIIKALGTPLFLLNPPRENAEKEQSSAEKDLADR